jgi:hypothetical protein
MNSSISGSDRRDHAVDHARPSWRRWLVVFCGTFFGVSALLLTFVLLMDPYDTGRFPGFRIVGTGDRSPRTAAASRGRDPSFNATVIGNSTGQLLDPYRLSRETGLHFTQLTIPATGPREQLTLMRWVISHHPAYRAFVVVTDMSWCSADPNLPLENPFPFWLYGGDGDYLANVLSSKALDRVVYRIQIALGMRKRSDPVGYSDYLIGRKPVFVPDPPAPPAPPVNVPAMQSPPPLPWVAQLGAFLATLPRRVDVVVVMPPVYFTLLPQPGSEQGILIDACKAALAKAIPDRPHSGFLDFRVDDDSTHDVTDFADMIHYREKLARRMEAAIISLLHPGGTGTAAVDDAPRTALGSRLNARAP